MKSNNVTVISVSAVACVALVAVVGLALALDDQAQLGTLAASILTGAATLIGLIVTIGRTERVAGQVDQVKDTVDDLANGKMDSKIRAAVADVMRDSLLDPHASQQIAQDRARRDG